MLARVSSQSGISLPHNHLDALYEQLKCVACKEHFNLGLRRPKLLGCGHTFSIDCLQRQLSNSGRVECPICAEVAILPVAVDAASLPNNVFLCDLMEQLPKSMLRQSANTSSSASLSLSAAPAAASDAAPHPNCCECKKARVSSHMCSQCSVYFCAAHASLHMADNNSHVVKPHENRLGSSPSVAGLGASPSTASLQIHRALKCLVHDKEYEFYCNQCNALVCASCYMPSKGGHRDHDISELSEAVTMAVADIADILPSAATRVDESSAILDRLQQTEQTLLQSLDTTGAAIGSYFDSLIAQLQRRRDQLRAESANAINAQIKQVRARSEAIESNKTILRTCAAFAQQDTSEASTNSTSVLSAKRVLLLNKMRSELAQRIDRSSDSSFFAVPEPLITFFEAPAVANVTQPSTLGVVRVTTVSWADTLLQGSLIDTQNAIAGQSVELHLQLRDAAQMSVPLSGVTWNAVLRPTVEVAYSGANKAAAAKQQREAAQRLRDQNLVVRDLGGGKYQVSFVAVLGDWRLLLSARGQSLPVVDFTVTHAMDARRGGSALDAETPDFEQSSAAVSISSSSRKGRAAAAITQSGNAGDTDAVFKCAQHDDDYKYFCSRCGVAVCASCYVLADGEHHGHKIITLEKARPIVASSLTSMLPLADNRSSDLQASLARHQQQERDLVALSASLHTQIDAHFDAVIQKMGDRKDEMCKQITDSVDAQLLSTRDRIDAIEAHLAALGACTANASQEVYVEMSKGADVTAQAARASGAIKSATGAAVAASVSPAAPLAPSLAQKRAAGQVERVLTLNAVKRELAAELEQTADLASHLPDYFVADFEASHLQIPTSIIGQLAVSTLSLEETELTSNSSILERKLAREGDAVEIFAQLRDSQRRAIKQAGVQWRVRLRQLDAVSEIADDASTYSAGARAAIAGAQPGGAAGATLTAGQTDDDDADQEDTKVEEVVVVRELGDGRYSFAFVASLGEWRLQLFARGLPLAPIDFVVMKSAPPRPLGPSGSLICTFGAQGKEAGEFNGPMGAAVDSNEGLVFIADCYNHRVQALRFCTGLDRRLGAEANSRGSGSKGRSGSRSSGGFSTTGSHLDEFDDETDEDALQDGDADIEVKLEWQYGVTNQPGDAPGLLYNPRGCALSMDGQLLYVADGSNNRVVALRTLDGAFVREFGTALGFDFCVPWGVAVSGDSVWVSDRDLNRITCFNANSGQEMRVLGQTATGGDAHDDEFNGPRGVAVHDGLLFIADDDNHRVQVFVEETGQFLHTIGQFNTPGSGDGQLNRPQGLAIDSVNNVLYVTEYGNKRVSAFDVSRDADDMFTFAFIGKFGRSGKGDGEFQCPIGIAVDVVRTLAFAFDYDLHRSAVWSAFH